MNDLSLRTITVNFRDQQMPPRVLETTERGKKNLGYELSAAGEAPSYRVWLKEATYVYPQDVVLSIETKNL